MYALLLGLYHAISWVEYSIRDSLQTYIACADSNFPETFSSSTNKEKPQLNEKFHPPVRPIIDRPPSLIRNLQLVQGPHILLAKSPDVQIRLYPRLILALTQRDRPPLHCPRLQELAHTHFVLLREGLDSRMFKEEGLGIRRFGEPGRGEGGLAREGRVGAGQDGVFAHIVEERGVGEVGMGFDLVAGERDVRVRFRRRRRRRRFRSRGRVGRRRALWVGREDFVELGDTGVRDAYCPAFPALDERLHGAPGGEEAAFRTYICVSTSLSAPCHEQIHPSEDSKG